ncbi:UbiA prenyltransferase family protein [Neolewinella persica]|uniref:hypothetical protein n=1 Tax=Neolewinella persica TaxID=70998 RepID=UPI00037D876F|nr:hypothetical protein [Neolewinella persica]
MTANRLFNWVFYGHVWIALAATGLSWLSLRLVYGNQTCVSEWPVLSFIFLATLGVYTLHRYLSFQRAGIRPQSRRYELVAEAPKTSLWIGGLSIALAILLSFTFLKAIWWCLLAAVPLTVFYLTPPLPGWRRLRDLPYLKVVWVAVAWTIMTVVLPVMVINTAASAFIVPESENDLLGLITPFSCLPPTMTAQNFYVECLIRLLFTGAAAMLFDLRDVVLDRSQGVRTMANERPRLHKVLVYGALIFCILMAQNLWDGCIYPSNLGISLGLAYLALLPITYLTYRKQDENWYAIVVNGLLLVPPFAYWLMSILGAGAGAGFGI